MTIRTHTDNRKAMVKAIAEYMGQERQYAGAPSFSYTIGSITVAKDGSITGDDADLRALLPFLMEQGYIDADAQDVPVEGHTDESASAENDEPDSQLSIQELCDCSDANTQAGSTGDEAENSPSPIQEQTSDDFDVGDSDANEQLSEGEMEAEQTHEQLSDDEMEAEQTHGQLSDDETEPEPTHEPSDSSEDSDLQISECIIKLGETSLTPLAATNLLFSLYAEQYLLNRAFGEDILSISKTLITRIQEQPVTTMDEFLNITGKAVESGELRGVEFGVGTFAMTFPADAAEPETRNMYVQLMHQLIKFAITATRVTPKLLKPESEKYYLHSWLLRLGCGGPDFKALRKRMLSGLDGYCAFPDEERAQKHKDRYKEIRRKAREGSKGSEASESTVNSESSEADKVSRVDDVCEEAEAV